MRTIGCTVQQALTAEAASVVKEAVTLAKRRGHAQVTPLHVANTMLTAANGMLRTACLKSNSHPLQCKALELCFNVALNRLPASNSSPMFGGHPQCPSISNALVAAFKRAQAHQRRGSIENQQQPLLAVKIELEQLIISILDDPSVSRVMREAGFSSPQVKTNVEQAVPLEICSQNNPSVSSKSKENNHLTLSSQTAGQIGGNTSKPQPEDPIRNEDVMSVIDSLTNQRRRGLVIVGECRASLEAVVRRVMHKKDVDDEALRDVLFVHLYLSTFVRLSKVDVDQKISELQSQTRSAGKSVVLYLGDLKWVVEYRTKSTNHQGRSYYCPVEHMVVEIGKLVSRSGDNGKIKLMALATFQTYMRCKIGHLSLETVWGLHHTLTIPAGSLSLSLITDSHLQKHYSTSKKADTGLNWLSLDGKDEKEKQLTCSDDSPEIRSCLLSSSCNCDSTTSTLPAWLQQYKNEIKGINANDQNCVPVIDLCKKWSLSACSSIHKQSNSSSEINLKFSTSPASSSSGHHYDNQTPHLYQTSISNGWPSLAQHKHQTMDHHHFLTLENANDKQTVRSLEICVTENHKDPKYPGSSNPHNSINPNSTSSSDSMETEYTSKFKEFSAENLKTLCNALEKKFPWQKDIVPDIVSTILQCRSGMLTRKGKLRCSQMKKETWLFFEGVDMDAKEKIARELAMLVFGSPSNLVSIGLSSFSSMRADSTEWRNKRIRDEQNCSFIEKFGDAVSCNPHRVFLVEDIEQADYCSHVGFKRSMERGRVTNSNCEEVSLSDAIVILCCESFSSRSRASSPPAKQKSSEGSQDEKSATTSSSPNLEDTITSSCLYLDLNISINDDSNEDYSIDDIGLLQSVDRRIIFKIQEL